MSSEARLDAVLERHRGASTARKTELRLVWLDGMRAERERANEQEARVAAARALRVAAPPLLPGGNAFPFDKPKPVLSAMIDLIAMLVGHPSAIGWQAVSHRRVPAPTTWDEPDTLPEFPFVDDCGNVGSEGGP